MIELEQDSLSSMNGNCMYISKKKKKDKHKLLKDVEVKQCS